MKIQLPNRMTKPSAYPVLVLAASLVANMNANALEVTPSTTEGPYYTLSSANTILSSSSANHAPHLLTVKGTDNDMIHIYAGSTQASGTITALSGTVVNTSGTAIVGATVELWIADNNGIYNYVSSSSGTNNYASRDQNFQGFGKCTTSASGAWSFLTIKPGLYVGRIRHYHLKVKVGTVPYVTTQLMPATEAAATPSDNIVASLGSSLSRCTYTPVSGTITWGGDSYTGQIVSGRQLVINYSASSDIAVYQPTGSSLTDGAAKKSFGTVQIGSRSAAKTFTIKNTGTAKLTGLSIVQAGVAKAEFTVSDLARTNLAAGESTTFKVRFKPVAAGKRRAAIRISSNDADENPFNIKLVGQGVAK